MAAPQTLVFVTGFAQLDAKLRAMPNALQKKFVRGGLRKCAKRVTKEFKQIVHAEAHDTGTLEKAAKPKALKRSRTRAGVGVYIDRDKLFAAYAAAHDGKPPHPAAGEKDPFYYPAAIEFGTATQQPVRPMRRALYDHTKAYIDLFRSDVIEFIDANKVSYKL